MCVSYMEGRVLRWDAEIIVITVIKIHGLFALEQRGGKGGPASSPGRQRSISKRNAAIHSAGSREYNRPRRVIKCLHWLNGPRLDSTAISRATAFLLLFFLTTYFSCICRFLYKLVSFCSFFLLRLPRADGNS